MKQTSAKPATLIPPRASRSSARLLGAALGLLAGSGCSITNMAVETQAEVMELAFPVIEEQDDFEYARLAAPANLLQLEGMLKVLPENERLLLLSCQGYSSYAFAFIEDEIQAADAVGDLDVSDAARERARSMYLKARDLGLRLLEVRHPGFKDAMGRDPDKLRKYLAENMDADDVPALFWTGNSWGNAIKNSLDQPEMIADLPYPTEFVLRAAELDESYYHAAGLVFLGSVNARMSKTMGGDWDKAREYFQRALKLTERESFVVHVNYAETYAVQVQDKKLFVGLLEEVLAAETRKQSPLALATAVSKRRARRLLDQVDNLILEPLPELPPEPAPADATESAPADVPTEAAPATGAAQPASPASAPKNVPTPAAKQPSTP